MAGEAGHRRCDELMGWDGEACLHNDVGGVWLWVPRGHGLMVLALLKRWPGGCGLQSGGAWGWCPASQPQVLRQRDLIKPQPTSHANPRGKRPRCLSEDLSPKRAVLQASVCLGNFGQF
jgi:hypothetical protein